MKPILLFLAFLLLIAPSSYAQMGHIDSLFYANMGLNSYCYGGIVQPDSAVIIIGTFTRCNERIISGITRLTPSGSNDYTFNSGGSGASGTVNMVLLQSNGQIIIGGTVSFYNGTYKGYLARLNSNGTLDNTFNTALNNVPYAGYVQSNGQIILAGAFSQCNDTAVDRIVRLNTNGSIDNSFTSTSPSGSMHFNALAVQSNGQLLLTGSFTEHNGSADTAVIRLNSDGVIDTTFKTSGAPASGIGYGIAELPSGKIVVCGSFSTWAGRTVNGIVRLNSNGSMDTTFSSGTGFGGGSPYCVYMQANGSMIMGGTFGSYNGSTAGRIICVDSTGSRDAVFDTSLSFSYTTETVFPNYDGRIFVGGLYSLAGVYSRLCLTLLQTSGNVDQTFFYQSNFNGQVYATATQSTGKIIVGGTFTYYDSSVCNYIARLNSNGSFDTSFHSGTGANGSVLSIVVLSNDKILIGGGFTSYNGTSVSRIGQLNSDGSLDGTFTQPTGVNSTVNTIAVSPVNGNIYFGGSFTGPKSRLGCLTASGSLVSTFGPSLNGVVDVVRIQSNGYPVIMGTFTTCNGISVRPVCRIDTLGNLDTTFAVPSGIGTYLKSMDLQSNGKVLIGGYLSGDYVDNVERLNTNGSVDSSFFISGVQTYVLMAYGNNEVLVAGGIPISGVSHYCVGAFDSTGALDNTFYAGTGISVLLGGGSIYFLGYDSINHRVMVGGDYNSDQGLILSNMTGEISTSFSSTAILDSASVLTPLCGGAVSKAYFKAVEAFNTGNVFTVQLSDSGGSFASPVNIGTLSSTAAGWDTASITIPGGTITGVHYKIQITATNPVYTSASSGYFVIGPLTDTITPGGATTFCAGNSVALSSKAENTYSWSTGATTQSITVTSTGSYTVSVTANGCTAVAASVSVTVNALPTATASSNSPVCIGQTLTLTGGANSLTSYAWSGPSSYSNSTQSPTVSSSATTAMGGTYAITVTNSYGCSATASTMVNIPAIDTPVTPAPQATCSDTAITFTFDSIVAGNNGNEIEWALNSSFDSSTVATSPAAITIIVSAGEQDTVWIRSKDSISGCLSSAITAYAATNLLLDNLSVTATADSICAGSSTFINISGTQIGIIYMLQLGNMTLSGAPGNDSTLQFTTGILDSTTIFTVFAMNPLSRCSINMADTVTVNMAPVPGLPQFTVGDTSVCVGDSGCFPATSANSSFLRYYITEGSELIDSTTGCVTDVSSNFSITAIATNDYGCQSSAIKYIGNIGAPQQPSAQSAVSDSAYTFTFRDLTVGNCGNQLQYSATWDFSSSVTIPSPDSLSVTLAPGEDTAIWLRSRDSVSGRVSLPRRLKAILDAGPSECCIPTATNFAVWYGNISVGAFYPGDESPILCGYPNYVDVYFPLLCAGSTYTFDYNNPLILTENSLPNVWVDGCGLTYTWQIWNVEQTPPYAITGSEPIASSVPPLVPTNNNNLPSQASYAWAIPADLPSAIYGVVVAITSTNLSCTSYVGTAQYEVNVFGPITTAPMQQIITQEQEDEESIYNNFYGMTCDQVIVNLPPVFNNFFSLFPTSCSPPCDPQAGSDIEGEWCYGADPGSIEGLVWPGGGWWWGDLYLPDLDIWLPSFAAYSFLQNGINNFQIMYDNKVCGFGQTWNLPVYQGPPSVTISPGGDNGNIICTNDPTYSSVTLNTTTLSSAYVTNYSWSTGETTSSITVSPTVTTTYTVTAIDIYMCPGTASITVNVISCCEGLPWTDINGGSHDALTLYSGATNLGSYLLYLTYLSDYFAHEPIPNAPITIGLNGNFEVATPGQTATATFSYINFLMGGNSKITVHSNQELDYSEGTIEGCDQMWQGIDASEPNAFFDANPEWYGQSTGQIIEGYAWYPVNIEDAEVAVNIGSGGTDPSGNPGIFALGQVGFYRNFIDAVVQGNPSTPISDNACFYGCTFDGQSDYLPDPFPTNTYQNSNAPQYGIGILAIDANLNIPQDNLNDAQFSNPQYNALTANTFVDKNCAILGLVGNNINVARNDFTNIHNNYTTGNQGFAGAAIYSWNYPPAGSASLNVQTTSQSAYIFQGLFQSCDYGVKVYQQPVTAQNNLMESVTNGIYTNNCTNTVNINSNLIIGTNFGITLNNNVESSQNVWENQIYVNEPVGGTFQMFQFHRQAWIPNNTIGIWQNDVTGTSANIFMNTIYGGRNCIALTNADGSAIYSNHLMQWGTTAVYGVQSGIYSSNGRNLNIMFNSADGNGNSTYDITDLTTANRKSGILLNSSPSAQICWNYMGSNSALGYGMYFVGNNADVNVWNNSFGASKYCMELEGVGMNAMMRDKQAQIANGTIYDNGNVWGSLYSSGYVSNTIDTFAPGPHYSAPVFYYNSGAITHEPTPDIATPSQDYVKTRTTDNSTTGCSLAFLFTVTQEKYLHSRVNETVATGYADTLMEAGYQATGPWLAQRNLYAALCDTNPPVARVSSLPPGIESFLTAFVDTTTDTLMLSAAAEILSVIESGDTATPDTGLTVDTLVANFFTAMQNSDFSAIQLSLNQAKVLRDTVNTQNAKNDSGSLATAWTLLANIPDTNAQEANFITVMTIYLNHISPGDTVGMDSASLNTLDSIALLCPYTGGDAVYYARALFSQYVDTMFFDDLILCSLDTADTLGGEYMMLWINNTQAQDTAQPAADTATALEFAKVYPNPARQLLNLAYYVNTTSPLEFDLIDQLGVAVIQEPLSGSQSFAQFSTGSLSSGLYYWVLKDSIRTIKSGKVAIMK